MPKRSHDHQEHDRLCPRGRRRPGRSAGTGRCAPSTAAASTCGCACRRASRPSSRASARPSPSASRAAASPSTSTSSAAKADRRSASTKPALQQVLAALDSLQTMIECRAAARRGAARHQGRAGGRRAEESEAEAQARTRGHAGRPRPRRWTAWCARAPAEGRRLEAIIARPAGHHRAAGGRPCEASPARTPDAIRQRLKEQVERLLETGVGARRGAPLPGGGAAGDARRRRGGTEAARRPHRRRARAARLQRAGRAAARLPGPGVQPRSQHAVLQGERSRDDAGRPGAEGRHRPDARAGAEH